MLQKTGPREHPVKGKYATSEVGIRPVGIRTLLTKIEKEDAIEFEPNYSAI